MWTQLGWLLWRSAKKLKRSWQIEVLDYALTIFTALIIGFFFFQVGNNQESLRNRLAIVFFSLARVGFNSLSAIPILYIERAVFYRQLAARYYSPVPYALQSIMYAI